MIVARHGSLLRLVTQPDHARFAAELLSLWRRDGLPDHPRRADLLFAAREHDNGWREADAAPRVDRVTGRPHDFRSLPRPERLEIWARGVDRHRDESPWAGLLIVEHALSLHRDRATEPGWAPFLDALRARRAELLESTGRDEDALRADYRWIELTDLLSLAACGGWPGPIERHGVRAEVGRGELHLEPFPLAGSTTFRIPCRELEARRFFGDADLGGALAEARWTDVPVRVAPAEET